VVSRLAEIGLMLAESKTLLLAKLQASMRAARWRRMRPITGSARHAGCCSRSRTGARVGCRPWFGTVEVEAPRFKVCRCRLTTPLAEVTVSPVCALLTARCTPELERVQAELGARTSFRDVAGILDRLLPASPATHESVLNCTHAVALRIEAADRQAAAEVTAVRDERDEAAAADASRPVVMLDGASVRAVPGHQVRNFEAICGKVEREGYATRRFALVRSVAEQPHALLRAALQGRFGDGFVRHDGVLGPACDPAQGLARLLVVAVPKQAAQPLDIDLSMVGQDEGQRFQGAQAAHDLLDVLHAHGEMKPVEDGSTGPPVAERTSAGSAGSPSLIAVTGSPSRQP